MIRNSREATPMNVLGKVTWELAAGVRAMRTLSQMLHQAGEAVAPPAELGGDRDHMGVFLADRSYWVGINYDWPELLYFSTEARAVDPEVAARLGIEGVYPCKETGGHGWRRKLNFECEEV